MRIAIDARELCGRPTGVGRYLSGLLDGWSAGDAFTRHQWILMAHAEPAQASQWPVEFRMVPGSGGTLWEQISLPSALRAERPDVFFAPGYTAPLMVTAPLVLTIHDVSYFAHPEWFSFREGGRRRTLTAWSARRARAVITDTQFSKGEIGAHIGIPADRIRVISLGLPPATPSPAPSTPREPLVLYVGSIFERRRVDRLIAAFDAVVDRLPEATLAVVGENRTRRPHIDLAALRGRTRHRDRIQLHSYVSDAALGDLYRRASVFAFLSEYEGFGFTPLEALREFVPPLLLDTPVARETCGEAARYVAPSAGDTAIAETLVELLTNREARQAVLRHADAIVSRYDWTRTAAQTLAVLEGAAVAR